MAVIRKDMYLPHTYSFFVADDIERLVNLGQENEPASILKRGKWMRLYVEQIIQGLGNL